MKRHRCHHCRRHIKPGETLFSLSECIATPTGRTLLRAKVYCSQACVTDNLA